MTSYDAFAGRLRNPDFDWSDPDQQLTSSDIEYLTESVMDGDVYSAAKKRMYLNGVPRRQLDWGSWVAPVTKADLIAYLANWKEGWDLPSPGDETDKPRMQRARCKKAIEELPDDGEYVIVCEEG